MPKKQEGDAEKVRELYWDTYQSWVDGFPEKYPHVRLFNGHPRGVPASVCNFPGAGQFPAGASATVLGMGVQVRTSEPHIEEILRANAVCSLCIGDRNVKQLSLRLAREYLTEEQRVAEVQDIPDGFLTRLEEEARLFVPPWQPIYVDLQVASAAEMLLRRLETRVGPGAGWAEVVVYLLCDRIRPVL